MDIYGLSSKTFMSHLSSMYLSLMFDRKCVTLHTLKLLHLKPTQIPLDQKSLLIHILRIPRSFYA